MLASPLTLSMMKDLSTIPKCDSLVKLLARGCPRFLQTTLASSMPQLSSQTGRPPILTFPDNVGPFPPYRQMVPRDKQSRGVVVVDMVVVVVVVVVDVVVVVVVVVVVDVVVVMVVVVVSDVVGLVGG